MTQLETIVTAHLEKSDAIWTSLSNNSNDIAWIKKAIWLIPGAVITFNITLVVGLILYLVKR